MTCWDFVRVYVALGGMAALIGMLVQLLHPQPGIHPHLQTARALFIVGTGAVLMGVVSGNALRLGVPPPVPMSLAAIAVGVSVLLAWLVFERKARKAGSP